MPENEALKIIEGQLSRIESKLDKLDDRMREVENSLVTGDEMDKLKDRVTNLEMFRVKLVAYTTLIIFVLQFVLHVAIKKFGL